jgi:membrane-associated PAP2 superfamily phosphatase
MTSGFLCAIRGPVMLITLGVLLSIDHFGSVSIWRTWPVMLIVFGVFKLMERSGARTS